MPLLLSDLFVLVWERDGRIVNLPMLVTCPVHNIRVRIRYHNLPTYCERLNVWCGVGVCGCAVGATWVGGLQVGR